MLRTCMAMLLECTRCCWQSLWEDALLLAASKRGNVGNVGVQSWLRWCVGPQVEAGMHCRELSHLTMALSDVTCRCCVKSYKKSELVLGQSAQAMPIWEAGLHIVSTVVTMPYQQYLRVQSQMHQMVGVACAGKGCPLPSSLNPHR